MAVKSNNYWKNTNICNNHVIDDLMIYLFQYLLNIIYLAALIITIMITIFTWKLSMNKVFPWNIYILCNENIL